MTSDRETGLPTICPQHCGCTQYVDSKNGRAAGGVIRRFDCGAFANHPTAVWDGGSARDRHISMWKQCAKERNGG